MARDPLNLVSIHISYFMNWLFLSRIGLFQGIDSHLITFEFISCYFIFIHFWCIFFKYSILLHGLKTRKDESLSVCCFFMAFLFETVIAHCLLELSWCFILSMSMFFVILIFVLFVSEFTSLLMWVIWISIAWSNYHRPK